MKHTAQPLQTDRAAPSAHVLGNARLTEAVSLLAQALQESEPAVRRIGDAIERMMHALYDDGLGSEELRRDLAKDLARCIHALQFHDRLTQQINYARDLITRPETCPLTARTRFQAVEPHESSIELF